MAIAWTLARANGDTRSFEAWGIRSAIDRRVSLGRGTVDLGFGRSDLLGALPFDPDETLVILANAAPYFRGRVIGEKRGAYGSAESAFVTLADPWWYLEKIIYCRSMKVVADGTANPAAGNPYDGLTIADFVTVSKTASDIVLSEDETGSLIDSKGNILAALNYAISKGAPIALGTIDAGLQIPREELHDVTCAEMVLKSLRWTPDQSAWWDYSVNPPALNIRTRANRALVSLDIANGALRRVEINPRRDLVLTGVTLNYLRRHQRTNFEFLTLDADSAGPTPFGIGALVATLELYGSYLATPAPVEGGAVPPARLVAQEAAPAGLALSLYNAYKDLSFEGSINYLAGDVSIPYLGRTLRVLSGAPAWSTATMDIQEAAIDLFAMNDADGEYYAVDLTVGPPRRLGPTDLVGLVRKGRTKPPPLIGGPYNGPGGGGSPRLPQWNYGNPDIGIGHCDLILYGWRWINAGFPGGYGYTGYDKANVYDVMGGIAHEIVASSIDIGSVVSFFGARIGRGPDKYIGLTGVFAIHDTAAGGLPTYEVDAWTRPVVVH